MADVLFDIRLLRVKISTPLSVVRICEAESRGFSV